MAVGLCSGSKHSFFAALAKNMPLACFFNASLPWSPTTTVNRDQLLSFVAALLISKPLAKAQRLTFTVGCSSFREYKVSRGIISEANALSRGSLLPTPRSETKYERSEYYEVRRWSRFRCAITQNIPPRQSLRGMFCLCSTKKLHFIGANDSFFQSNIL